MHTPKFTTATSRGTQASSKLSQPYKIPPGTTVLLQKRWGKKKKMAMERCDLHGTMVCRGHSNSQSWDAHGAASREHMLVK